MTSKSAILKEASRHTGKHGGVEKRAVAYANTILRIQVGSGLMGISVNGTDDRDEMGVCIEPPLYVIGLREFELYEHHTAWEREGGLRNRSGHGDLDENVYSLRKFTRLALAGNPSIITMFFVPETEIVSVSPFGRELLAQAPDVISREAAARYYGYRSAGACSATRARAATSRGPSWSRSSASTPSSRATWCAWDSRASSFSPPAG
jgi:hypothetical protein